MSNRRNTGRGRKPKEPEGDDVGFDIELKLEPEDERRLVQLTRTVDGLADLDTLADDLRKAGLTAWADRVQKIREGMSLDGDTDG